MAKPKTSHPLSRKPVTATFFATGRAGKDDTKIEGWLIDQHGGRIDGKPIRPPLSNRPWVLRFKDIPRLDGSGNNLVYELHVKGDVSSQEDLVPGLTIKPGQLGMISFPDNNTNHDRFDFISYGLCSNAFDHGTMGNGNDDDHFWDGENWCAQWYVLAAATYRLDVFESGTAQSFDNRTGLNLS